MLHVIQQLYKVLPRCRENVPRVEASQAANYTDGQCSYAACLVIQGHKQRLQPAQHTSVSQCSLFTCVNALVVQSEDDDDGGQSSTGDAGMLDESRLLKILLQKHHERNGKTLTRQPGPSRCPRKRAPEQSGELHVARLCCRLRMLPSEGVPLQPLLP